MTIDYRPIGSISSPFRERLGTPRQAAGAAEITATIEILPEFAEGLSDIEGFSHLVVVFHLHLVEQMSLTVYPPWDTAPHGVFATCSPFRPNPLGISVVRLLNRNGTTLTIAGVDMVDDTPVIDLKPYVPSLFPHDDVTVGWLTGKETMQNYSKAGDGPPLSPGTAEQLVIRDALLEDLDRFRLMELDGDTAPFINPYPLERHQAEFEKAEIRYKSILGPSGELVGFMILALDPDGVSLELRRIVVAVRGRGYGKVVLRRAGELAREFGRSRVWLDVFAHNERARHVYEGAGFELVGETVLRGKPLLIYARAA